jgi:hypothetical protein
VLVAVAAGLTATVAIGWVVLRAGQPGPPSVPDAVERFQDHAEDTAPSPTPRPPAGVYTYRGEGHEHLSFPPLDQQDGAELPGTVTHGRGGCWTFRIDFNQGHWQGWHYCPSADGRGVVERGGDSGQRWNLGVNGLENTSHFTCEDNPVLWDAAAGDEVDHRCTGTNTAIDGSTTSEGTWRYRGSTSMTIGGQVIEVLHVVGHRHLSGSQEGEEATESWFRPDGLLVRYERDIEVHTDSPIGEITYTESGWFELTDLDAQR